MSITQEKHIQTVKKGTDKPVEKMERGHEEVIQRTPSLNRLEAYKC